MIRKILKLQKSIIINLKLNDDSGVFHPKYLTMSLQNSYDVHILLRLDQAISTLNMKFWMTSKNSNSVRSSKHSLISFASSHSKISCFLYWNRAAERIARISVESYPTILSKIQKHSFMLKLAVKQKYIHLKAILRGWMPFFTQNLNTDGSCSKRSVSNIKQRSKKVIVNFKH